VSHDQLGQAQAGLSRRTLLHSVAATGAMVIGFGALDGLVRAAAADPVRAPLGRGHGGYGQLRPLTRQDPETGFSQQLLLPEGSTSPSSAWPALP
jgi:hypothetical protein